MISFVSGLEINERPLKRPLLDLEKLSISDSSGKGEISIVLFIHRYFCDFFWADVEQDAIAQSKPILIVKLSIRTVTLTSACMSCIDFVLDYLPTFRYESYE